MNEGINTLIGLRNNRINYHITILKPDMTAIKNFML